MATLVGVSLSLLLSSAHPVFADSSKPDVTNQMLHKQALDFVYEYTNKICMEVPRVGGFAEGSLKATFESLLMKLGILGFDLKGGLRGEIWYDMPHNQFAEVWKLNSECRQKMAALIMDHLVRRDPPRPYGEDVHRPPEPESSARRQECARHYASFQKAEEDMRRLQAELDAEKREESRLDDERDRFERATLVGENLDKVLADIGRRGDDLIIRTRKNGTAIRRIKENMNKHSNETIALAAHVKNCASIGML